MIPRDTDDEHSVTLAQAIAITNALKGPNAGVTVDDHQGNYRLRRGRGVTRLEDGSLVWADEVRR